MATLGDLLEIQEACVSARTDDPAEVRAWIEEIGIENDAFEELLEIIGSGAKFAAAMAQKMGVPPSRYMAALFASGFELGVRYQQTREP